MPIQVGQLAPEFQLPDHQGQVHDLTQYHGQWVLLYFYPKDNTPGCTTEACNFRDAYAELKQELVLLGVSGDSAASHQKFAEKYQLPFPLLIDESKQILHDYGADGVIFPKRVSFLIDPEGKIAKIYEKVKVDSHAAEVLQDVREMKGEL